MLVWLEIAEQQAIPKCVQTVGGYSSVGERLASAASI